LASSFAKNNTLRRAEGRFMSGRVLVLGVGNTLLSDEGIGVHCVRHLESLSPDLPDVEFLDAGTLSFTLAAALEGARGLIIIDAARMNEPAGSVRVHEGEAMDRFLARRRGLSVHEVSLVDLLQIARLTGALPVRRALIGIEPASLDWGESPTAEVARAIPRAAERARELIVRWRSIPVPEPLAQECRT
jgi:hydrogenase maturation protease